MKNLAIPKGPRFFFCTGDLGQGIGLVIGAFFDPVQYRIILFDQRGSGKSTPHASLEENTTWHLVEDIETLRKHLGIAKWVVLGGSWGSTLALTYAIAHSDRILGLILRSIFLFQQEELDFTYQHGANQLFPEAWEDFIRLIPPEERGDLIKAYHRRLTCGNPEQMQEAAIAWTRWEATLTCLLPNAGIIQRATEDRFALSFARAILHYFYHRGFFPREHYLLEEVHQIRHLPGQIIHGRYDLVCPVQSAWKLHQAWPESRLTIVPDAAHGAMEVGMMHSLLEATDRFRQIR